MIFGHCVWIPPSPKAALVALNLFFGIGTSTQPDIIAAESIIGAQYVAGGKTQVEAQKEVSWLNACFGSYEVSPENRNHREDAKLTPLRNAQPRSTNRRQVSSVHRDVLHQLNVHRHPSEVLNATNLWTTHESDIECPRSAGHRQPRIAAHGHCRR